MTEENSYDPKSAMYTLDNEMNKKGEKIFFLETRKIGVTKVNVACMLLFFLCFELVRWNNTYNVYFIENVLNTPNKEADKVQEHNRMIGYIC